MNMQTYKTGEDRESDAALKSGLSALEREKKKHIRKMIIKWIITQIVSGLMILAKIALPIIIFLIVYTSISGVISDWIIEDDEEQEQQNPSTPVEPGNPGDPSNPVDNDKGIDVTQSNYIWTQEQITNFINNYETSNSGLKNQILNKKSDIKKWQDNYGYGAGVLVAIAIEDNTSDFNRFLEFLEQKAARWKDAGYTGIYEIARDYVGNDTAIEWANNIINKINKTATDSGIIRTGQEIQVSGDGYDSEYISKAGKTYYNYKQNKESSFSNYVWFGDSDNTIAYNGCALVSATIIINGYLGIQKTPKDVVLELSGGGRFSYAKDPTSYLTDYGISASRPYDHQTTELNASQKQEIIDNLRLGRPVIIKVTKVAGSDFPYGSYGEHWMALLDYNESNDKIYLSNPSYGSSPYGDEGWISKERVLRGCVEFIRVNQ